MVLDGTAVFQKPERHQILPLIVTIGRTFHLTQEVRLSWVLEVPGKKRFMERIFTDPLYASHPFSFCPFTLRCIMLRTLCHVIFMLCYFYVMLCYVMLMLCYVMLCYVMLCYVMLCYVMLCYVMLCYVMLCYVMLCYVMLCLYIRHVAKKSVSNFL